MVETRTWFRNRSRINLRSSHVAGLSSRKRRFPRLLICISIGLVGCQSDNRISFGDLQTAEAKLEQDAVIEPFEPEQLQLVDDHPYRILVGDTLLITLYGLAEEPYSPTALELRVQNDGSLVMPVTGPIPVGGKTLIEVEQAIRGAHVPAVVKDLSVFVQLADTQPTTVMVMGAVQQPGMITLRQNERNMLYALAAAGGFQALGPPLVQLKPVGIDREVGKWNFADPNDIRRALISPPLESGDLLLVESASSGAIFVSGTVNAPGPVAVTPGGSLSVLKAVSAAGGIKPYIKPKDATLVRRLASGDQVHVKLELKDMIEGKTPDVDLKEGDVLMVAQNFDTFAQEWFLQNVLVGPFQVGVRYDPLSQYNANRAIDAADDNDDLVTAIRASLATSIPQAVVPPVTAP